MRWPSIATRGPLVAMYDVAKDALGEKGPSPGWREVSAWGKLQGAMRYVSWDSWLEMT